MHGGRWASVSLLDGECLEISVTARLSVDDVLALAAHHCRIAQRDARYFGIAFVDDHDHYHWLQADKKLLDYEFPTSKAIIRLSHNVRFFVDSIFSLDDPATTELFFFEAHQQLRKGHLDLCYVDYVRIGSLLLQIYRGDFIEDISLRNHLRLLAPFIPRFLSHHDLDQDSFERQVLTEYSAMRGVQRGSAIISLMRIVEKCSKYGSRLYQVNEKSGSHCVLSINSRGIQVFDSVDTIRPKEVCCKILFL